MAQFTEKEKIIINSNTLNTPFKVLSVYNEEEEIQLRTKSEDIDIDVDSILLNTLIERMKVTLDEEMGVGLAAPQVGIMKNIFLFVRIDLPDEPVAVAINPRILNHADKLICFDGDGCLSVPGQSGDSMRYPWIEVEYINEKGELIREKLYGHSRQDNFVAVIFQHEFDHLQGILYTDKLCEDQ
ncbi:peptide deformylase [Dysgonomonas sp. 216]|uniref:peptide deformylase n=1 Tax=Dysgonomonas sp. 216 TaxID=2302934 RepID=UPI0013D2123C|nr:peptide deformylase [Dysgonomonas sp. 216]NDW17345.1 peptide deformylase [Dysgonomonas sp. 216]